jgi:hypothetical protein
LNNMGVSMFPGSLSASLCSWAMGPWPQPSTWWDTSCSFQCAQRLHTPCTSLYVEKEHCHWIWKISKELSNAYNRRDFQVLVSYSIQTRPNHVCPIYC